MDHLTLSKQFNTIAFELVKNASTVNTTLTSLQDDVVLRRVVFGRFYYSLYHKYLAHDSDLSSKSGSGKHDAILQKIRNCNDPKLYQTFSKAMNLRVWADYKLTNDKQALSVNLNTLSNDIWKFINRSNISC